MNVWEVLDTENKSFCVFLKNIIFILFILAHIQFACVSVSGCVFPKCNLTKKTEKIILKSKWIIGANEFMYVPNELGS